MKTPFLTLAVFANALVLHAQGTFQFTVNLNGANEVPPNNSAIVGSGTFSLTGTTLTYVFGGPGAFAGTTGNIDGPALPGSIGPMIFNLGAPGIAIQNPPDPGGYQFSGTLKNLSGTQISQLESGLWYANVLSGAFPCKCRFSLLTQSCSITGRPIGRKPGSAAPREQPETFRAALNGAPLRVGGFDLSLSVRAKTKSENDA